MFICSYLYFQHVKYFSCGQTMAIDFFANDSQKEAKLDIKEKPEFGIRIQNINPFITLL